MANSVSTYFAAAAAPFRAGDLRPLPKILIQSVYLSKLLDEFLVFGGQIGSLGFAAKASSNSRTTGIPETQIGRLARSGPMAP
jgi:hypothetical protein